MHRFLLPMRAFASRRPIATHVQAPCYNERSRVRPLIIPQKAFFRKYIGLTTGMLCSFPHCFDARVDKKKVQCIYALQPCDIPLIMLICNRRQFKLTSLAENMRHVFQKVSSVSDVSGLGCDTQPISRHDFCLLMGRIQSRRTTDDDIIPVQ
jgi:hypothetical protein